MKNLVADWFLQGMSAHGNPCLQGGHANIAQGGFDMAPPVPNMTFTGMAHMQAPPPTQQYMQMPAVGQFQAPNFQGQLILPNGYAAPFRQPPVVVLPATAKALEHLRLNTPRNVDVSQGKLKKNQSDWLGETKQQTKAGPVYPIGFYEDWYAERNRREETFRPLHPFEILVLPQLSKERRLKMYGEYVRECGILQRAQPGTEHFHYHWNNLCRWSQEQRDEETQWLRRQGKMSIYNPMGGPHQAPQPLENPFAAQNQMQAGHHGQASAANHRHHQQQFAAGPSNVHLPPSHAFQNLEHPIHQQPPPRNFPVPARNRAQAPRRDVGTNVQMMPPAPVNQTGYHSGSMATVSGTEETANGMASAQKAQLSARAEVQSVSRHEVAQGSAATAAQDLTEQAETFEQPDMALESPRMSGALLVAMAPEEAPALVDVSDGLRENPSEENESSFTSANDSSMLPVDDFESVFGFHMDANLSGSAAAAAQAPTEQAATVEQSEMVPDDRQVADTLLTALASEEVSAPVEVRDENPLDESDSGGITMDDLDYLFNDLDDANPSAVTAETTPEILPVSNVASQEESNMHNVSADVPPIALPKSDKFPSTSASETFGNEQPPREHTSSGPNMSSGKRGVKRPAPVEPDDAELDRDVEQYIRRPSKNWHRSIVDNNAFDLDDDFDGLGAAVEASVRATSEENASTIPGPSSSSRKKVKINAPTPATIDAQSSSSRKPMPPRSESMNERVSNDTLSQQRPKGKKTKAKKPVKYGSRPPPNPPNEPDLSRDLQYYEKKGTYVPERVYNNPVCAFGKCDHPACQNGQSYEKHVERRIKQWQRDWRIVNDIRKDMGLQSVYPNDKYDWKCGPTDVFKIKDWETKDRNAEKQKQKAAEKEAKKAYETPREKCKREREEEKKRKDDERKRQNAEARKTAIKQKEREAEALAKQQAIQKARDFKSRLAKYRDQPLLEGGDEAATPNADSAAPTP